MSAGTMMFGWLKKTLTTQPKEQITYGSPGVELSEQENVNIYAIGDVHGRLDLLLEAERRIDTDIINGEESIVIYLGDYIDRGPESAGVLEHLQNEYAAKFRRLCLRGNHDDVFLHFLEHPLEEWGWLDLGGKETLRSYGLTLDPYRDRAMDEAALRDLLQAHVPAAHRAFLSKTPLWARSGNFLFVHAGIHPGVAIERQDPLDFMWIREPFLSEGPGLPLTVVHGHTPQNAIFYGPNRIGIDTGAYATGRLSVLKVAGGVTSEL